MDFSIYFLSETLLPIRVMYLFKSFLFLLLLPALSFSQTSFEEKKELIQKEINRIAPESSEIDQKVESITADKQALLAESKVLKEKTTVVEKVVKQSISSPEVGALLKSAYDYTKRLKVEQIPPFKLRAKEILETYATSTLPIILTSEEKSAFSNGQITELENLLQRYSSLRVNLEKKRESLITKVKENMQLTKEITLGADELSNLTLSNMLWQKSGKTLWDSFSVKDMGATGIELKSHLAQFRQLSLTSLPNYQSLALNLLLIPLILLGAYLLIKRISRRVSDSLWLNLLIVSVKALVPSFIILILASHFGTRVSPSALSSFFLDLARAGALFLGIILVTWGVFSMKGLLAERFNLPKQLLKWVKSLIFFTSFSFFFLVALPEAFLKDIPSLSGVLLAFKLSFTALIMFHFCVNFLEKDRAFAQHILNGHTFLSRNWNLIRVIIMLMLLGSLTLGAFGYYFAWQTIQWAVIQSIAFIIFLSIFYPSIREVVLKGAGMLTNNWDSALQEENSAEEDSSKKREELKLRLKRTGIFVDNTFLILTLIAFYFIWNASGILSSALSQVSLFSWNTGESEVSLTLQGVIMAVGVLSIIGLAARSLPSLFELFIFPRFQVDPGISYAVISISRYILFAVGVLIALAYLKVDLSKIGWLVAALGVGLGFGLQEIVSNFICGLILLIERPIRVGDIVTIDGVSGEVTKINIRSTTVTDWNKLENVIPNKSFITEKVTNWSLSDKLSRIVVPIGVAYGTDPDRVKKILVEIAEADDRVLSDPAPMALFRSHGDSSLDFELRAYIDDFSQRIWVEDALVTELNRRLTKENIEIPFPQRDIHVIKGEVESN